MKNALLNAFLGVFILSCIVLFEEIIGLFYVISDLLWLMADFDIMCIILGVCFIIFLVIFFVHYFKRKSNNEIITTVEFNCPDDMTPPEVGFLVDGVVNDGDMSALFVYWASKNFISIEGEKKKQSFTRLVKDVPQDMRDYEKTIFTRIFGNKNTVKVSEIPAILQNTTIVNSAVKSIEKNVGTKYFDSKTIWFRQLYICVVAFLFYFSVMYFRLEYFVDVVPIIEIFAIVATCLFVFISGWILTSYDNRHKHRTQRSQILSWITFGTFLSACVGLSFYFFWTDIYQAFFLLGVYIIMFLVVFFSRKIRIYNKEGEKRLGKILGFRAFIDATETDRIQMLVEQEPKIFYKVLPYAFVLGVSDKWIKYLDVIKNNPTIVESKTLASVNSWVNVFSNSTLRLVNLSKVASVSRTGGSISFGSNGGAGSSKGGSNFGGFRRR
ncbi:MAG: DUF2207 family protein [Candidatus Caccovivens sp.]